ncbi:six-hairpin glycosidase-like protein [Joostella atrarenae]|uniref:Six-hairpin glycosidase-like protein n=1 Tax=Joostella atrarenae TaxID=679257 RepID=A0ABS9J556_9FLAO|nr:six-hairpin glycosidase-like protein [Joostella atrarenae]MCF8715515.1 six-hairpin glycosidase-like protein [Joostella atrarenae]
MNFVLKYLILLLCLNVYSQKGKLWKIEDKGSIILNINKNKIHKYNDNIEMSGRKISSIIHYSYNDEGLKISRDIYYPQLRTYLKTSDPSWKEYRAYLKESYSDEILPSIEVNNLIFSPSKLNAIVIEGKLEFIYMEDNGLVLSRTFYPSMNDRLFVEEWSLKNVTEKHIEINGTETTISREINGERGVYRTKVESNLKEKVTIGPNESYSFVIAMSASLNNESSPSLNNINFESVGRANFLNKMKSSLILETPNSALNRLFYFSKIRASESIFDSKIGLVHSPGGGRYYVGFWANDQAEYVSPFFPYLGYDLGIKSSNNMYELYEKETNLDFTNIRYSFEMEGDAPINEQDRGDAAMIAYGATQYVMALGSDEEASRLWPLIEWCLEYNKRMLNRQGVVSSDSDEMEGRIETGTANLSTSSLYYGALNLAADLAQSMGKPKRIAEEYRNRAEILKMNIEKYFGANIEGLVTYKYYKEHEYLRHWICLPLVVGIFERKEGTVDALLDRLWSENGIHVENNSKNEDISKIFWDRGTLYALRGTFLANETDRSLEKLISFTEKRLLGDRVPYVVEAYPEGGMAHLSAESGLYCRIFTEGILGITPTGLNSFSFTPKLPTDWSFMNLKNIKAFGQNFSIELKKKQRKMFVKVTNNISSEHLFEKEVMIGDKVDISF